ncbi:MAG: hypothetical protein QG622_2001 [Actinomycetota bacterium]|nr:hypothetical protein [Actinomycetota bacterium]
MAGSRGVPCARAGRPWLGSTLGGTLRGLERALRVTTPPSGGPLALSRPPPEHAAPGSRSRSARTVHPDALTPTAHPPRPVRDLGRGDPQRARSLDHSRRGPRRRHRRVADPPFGQLTRPPDGRESVCAGAVAIATVIAHTDSPLSARRVHDPVPSCRSLSPATVGDRPSPSIRPTHPSTIRITSLRAGAHPERTRSPRRGTPTPRTCRYRTRPDHSGQPRFDSQFAITVRCEPLPGKAHCRDSASGKASFC